jgi:ribosomal protein S18 acetylase RimI-like enzyme
MNPRFTQPSGTRLNDNARLGSPCRAESHYASEDNSLPRTHPLMSYDSCLVVLWVGPITTCFQMKETDWMFDRLKCATARIEGALPAEVETRLVFSPAEYHRFLGTLIPKSEAVLMVQLELLKLSPGPSYGMTIQMREFQTGDREVIKEMVLEAENFGTPFLDHEMLRIDVYTAFPQLGKILVAFDSGNKEVLGYTAIQFDWRALVINSIITHHGHLREGVGSRMIEEVKEIGKKHTLVDVIRVDTGDFMEYSQQFYLSCGFERAAYVPHYLS